MFGAPFVDDPRLAAQTHMELEVEHLAQRPELLDRPDVAPAKVAHKLGASANLPRGVPGRPAPGREGLD